MTDPRFQSNEMGGDKPRIEPTFNIPEPMAPNRDELAIMFACALVENGHILHPDKMANTAYEMSDAMLRERTKGTTK